MGLREGIAMNGLSTSARVPEAPQVGCPQINRAQKQSGSAKPHTYTWAGNEKMKLQGLHVSKAYQSGVLMAGDGGESLRGKGCECQCRVGVRGRIAV